MTKDRYRSIGAIIGLCLGVGLMIGLGYSGMIPGALFGAGGAVLGGISGESFFAWRNRPSG